MNHPHGTIYNFGPYRLDVTERTLWRGEQVIRLTPKAFDTLVVLLENHNHVVTKENMLRTIWPDSFVEEGGLSRNIHTLRKSLESNGEPAYIETIPKVGYRFIFPVQTLHFHESSLEAVDDQSSPPQINPNANATHKSFPLSTNSMDSRSTPSLTAKLAQPWILGTVLITLFSLGAIIFIHKRATDHSPYFSEMTIAPLSSNGKIREAIISPDGAMLAQIEEAKSGYIIQVRKVIKGGLESVLFSSPQALRGLAFSPDQNFLFFLKVNPVGPSHDLCKIPVTGGPPSSILSDVAGGISISPDGSRIAFIRYDAAVSEHSLLAARLDGTTPKILAVRKLPEYFSLEGTAWSPDSQFIICAAGQYNRGAQQYLSTFRLSDNSEKEIGSKHWNDIRGMAWAMNGAGVAICARNGDGAGPRQLWWISLPQGEARHITNDLNDYRGVSLANNLEKLVSVQSDTTAGIWLAPEGDISLARQVSSGKQDGTSGVCWTSDHNLIYSSHLNGQIHLWTMKDDGTAARPLTSEASRNEFPDVTPDGRFVVFCSNRSGTVNIWRMDLKGRNLVQLTRGDLDLDPICTPDNRWVIFSSNPLKRRSLWKIPIQGGTPQPVTDKITEFPTLSPDGRWIACSYRQDNNSTSSTVALLDLASGKIGNLMPDIPSLPWRLMRWHPDGNSLYYAVNRGGAFSIWQQPIQSGRSRLIAEFKTDRIFSLAWSRDGKYLTYSRGNVTSNIVQIALAR